MDRQTILILHGWGRGNFSWQKTKQILEKNSFLVFVPDLPGFGQEPPPEKPWAIDDYLEWMNKYINKNGLTEFFLLGHSFGGRLAIKLAVRYPEKLKGLILVSAAGLESEKSIQEISVSILAPYFKKLSFLPGYQLFRKLFYRFILKKTDYLRAKGIMKEVFKKVIREDLGLVLEKIFTPTLIIWGDNDKTLPLSEGQMMNRKIKNSQLEIMKGIDHTPQIEAPELLAQKIIEFIKAN
ncbi:MAG: alpha/beta hydrolase [bacterium]|nr:alpha/beta hydrolase [bacterium]